MYVRAFVHVFVCLSGFVQTKTSIFMYGFENNLTQLFPLMSRNAIAPPGLVGGENVGLMN